MMDEYKYQTVDDVYFYSSDEEEPDEGPSYITTRKSFKDSVSKKNTKPILVIKKSLGSKPKISNKVWTMKDFPELCRSESRSFDRIEWFVKQVFFFDSEKGTIFQHVYNGVMDTYGWIPIKDAIKFKKYVYKYEFECNVVDKNGKKTERKEIVENKVTIHFVITKLLEDCNITFVKDLSLFLPYGKIDRRNEIQRGTNVFNLFQGFRAEKLSKTITHDDECIQKILGHVSVLTNHEPESYTYALNWLAFNIQDPGHPIGVMWVVKSDIQGTGKSSFFEWFGQYVLGIEYFMTSNPNNNLLDERFNMLARGKKLYLLNEQDEQGECYKHSQSLKDALTSPFQTFEAKNVDRIIDKNITSYVVTTNKENNFKIEKRSERRTFATEVDPKYAKNKKYFNELYSNPELTAANFYIYLNQRDISDFNPEHIPFTSLRERLIESSKSNIQQFLEDAFINDTFDVLENTSTHRMSRNNEYKISINDMFANYIKWTSENNVQFKYKKQKFISLLKQYFGNTKAVNINNKTYKGWALNIEQAKKSILSHS